MGPNSESHCLMEREVLLGENPEVPEGNGLCEDEKIVLLKKHTFINLTMP